jgi:predicted transcriptional regulator
MKKIARRDKLKIYGDLLSILNDSHSEKVVFTHVQVRLNVPFDRLKNYLSELHNLGLIEDEIACTLSDKGKQYLREYEAILDFMQRFGIGYMR